MKQCAAVALLPPPDHVVRLAAPGNPPQAGYVLCELGEAHDDDHACLLWEDDANREAVWVRWNGGRARLAGPAWCPAVDARSGDACGLFAGHPSVHDWDVVDPTVEALDAYVVGWPDLAGPRPDPPDGP
ncbi:hypothetical protein AMK21_16430 [Streptomyces sp. CB00316]|uniref:hypothetical protein n=1 Tax=unclassified Streptomyces TaxID=2593676 RepID=UPI00093BF3D6|nr:hypothetical protein [Streptomyces sp. CB00316]OKJ19917.1 hypothetical protein AMK21_16430 [Streptomyces sp. CB00316]